MVKKVILLAALAVMTTLALATTAVAKDGDIIKAGVCTGSSTSKLKIGPRDEGLEVEWEVDSNVNGQTWSWKLKDNGVVQAKGKATTQPPSGSFEVRRVLVNQAGSDQIIATATNPATGESCRAAATVNA